MTNKPLPRIAVTMGDPAGIGPELCLKLLNEKGLREVCTPLVVGDAAVLRRVADHCSLPPPDLASVLTIAGAAEKELAAGAVNAFTGMAAYNYLTAAIDLALAGKVDAVTTCPLHKEALAAAGIEHPGHTEILAEKTRANRYCMMLTSPEITCSLVTAHVGLCDVANLLTVEGILQTIELSGAAMRQIRGREPNLVVCGLNPHAGEHGLFGNREEERTIVPAIEQAKSQGWQVSGPLPPDTAFLPSVRSSTDCYICMYHDQGLIPLKALAFDRAVNITLGLPIVRTSVDHGTALDIAWQNKADPSSLFHAVRLAASLVV